MKRSPLPAPIATATIAGVKTNRVKVSRPRAPKEPKCFHTDTTVHGRGVKTVCISLPPDDLAAIDLAAAALKVSRSQFLRDAALERAQPPSTTPNPNPTRRP